VKFAMAQSPNLSKEQEKAQRDLEIKRSILNQILSNEARDRLTRISLVKPEKVSKVEMILIEMARAGRIQSRVTESELITLLESISLDNRVENTPVIVRRDEDDELCIEELMGNL
jgi:programmed cell death protein 5